MATVQGYGSITRRVAAAGLGVLAAVSLSACSLLSDPQASRPIVIPGTDELQTETPTSSIAPASKSREAISTAPTIPPRDSLARAIEDATRVSTSGFHVGSEKADDAREEGISGVHFSTPDRAVRCSTDLSPSGSLACVSDRVRGPDSAPASAPAGCDWDGHEVLLNSDGITQGACTNQYPVMYRSTILDFGSAITVSRYSCLSDPEALYCLESGTDRGFAITRNGFSEIHGDDRAPGVADDDNDDPLNATSTTSTR
ncbi:MAG: hypothetical protein QM774_00620 [Gordonia sp. (in: high G+C Gram-positive bacteria)]|uniref:hypothetical protein n=1 Tax=Gordonia sp. (in: high G+C Gram-positive bacteria) TaxID=84139 RepID=UPI0039E4C945